MTTKIRIFISLLIAAAIVVIFSAGQILQLCQYPKTVFWMSISAIILLCVGFFLGRNSTKDKSDKDSEKEKSA